MKKSDLKSGMVVKVRDKDNSNLGLLVDTDLGLLIQFNDTWNNLHCYNEDLTHVNNMNKDIIQIRKVEYGYQLIREDLYTAPIIWTRSEETVLTMKEIAEKFNIPVEQLKIKK